MDFPLLYLSIFLFFLQIFNCSGQYSTEDVFVPADCSSIANVGDHLLLEYQVFFANDSLAAKLEKPSQLLHVLLTTQDDLPVLSALKGMCANATRRIRWEDGNQVNLLPILISADVGLKGVQQGVYVDVKIERITTAEEYQIFSALRQGNTSQVFDLIEAHTGVNAVDEWGHTPLMIAVQTNKVDVAAALLNTRLPKVDVNAAKSSGYTALFYGVENASPSLLTALLRRGADPNAVLLQDGARGNTPLHFACLLEKTKAAELLLLYGADPTQTNQHGQRPLQLLPRDAVSSVKRFFQRMMEEAVAKQRGLAQGEGGGGGGGGAVLPPIASYDL